MFNKTRIITLALACVTAAGASMTMATPAQAGVWERVAHCESTGNWHINSGNSFYGGLQFTHQTWQGFGGGAYAYNAHQASKAVQIMIARRVLIGQGPGAWPVCSVRAGLTRSSGQVSGSRSAARASFDRGRLAVDGIVGPLTLRAMHRHRIYLNTKPAIRAWQHRLRVKADGLLGPITARAMQRWLNAH